MNNGRIWVCDDEPSERFPVFTRGNVGEVFVEAVTPLTWSAFGRQSWEPAWRDAFCGIGAFSPEEFKPAGQPEITACFGGYVYINMSVTRVLAVRIPGMTVEAIDRSLFGDYPDVPPYRPDPRDENPERTTAVSQWLQSLFVDDPRPVNADNLRRLEAFLADTVPMDTQTDQELVARFRSYLPEARHLFRQHVLNGYGANVLASVIAQICEAVGAKDLAAAVTAGLGDVESAQPSFELWTLSRLVRASASLSLEFDRGVEGLLERLQQSNDPDARRFLDTWNQFLDRWGFLGISVWDLRSPTYRDHPEIALRMLERTRTVPDDAAPERRSGELVRMREAAIADVSARLAGNPQVQGQFVGAARACARYLAAREAGKTHCTRLNDEARRVMRALGTRMTGRGHLPRWGHVLLLNDDELDAFVAEPTVFATALAERATRLAVLEGLEPPFVFEGSPPPLAVFRDRNGQASGVAAAGRELHGIGVSAGCHTGRARIVRSLEADIDLEPGEVIVAPITDASWGPLFLAAGAVVVETGAAISHAAIVSRELGIPAVVSVTGATSRIPDGSMVTVDGGAGVVTLL
ncbi:MAG: phosphoenolpyruvate-utilizing protein [Betaproteobacteria bacterium]|nr:phosphoenolpyruvate-utilizing protein [Betaproteobacteria bacterium]